MEFYKDRPIRNGDLVRVAPDARSGLDGSLCRVTRVNNLTAMAQVCHVNRGGCRTVHVSKLEIISSGMIQQMKMELKL